MEQMKKIKWQDPELVSLVSEAVQGYCGDGSTPESGPAKYPHKRDPEKTNCSQGGNPTSGRVEETEKTEEKKCQK